MLIHYKIGRSNKNSTNKIKRAKLCKKSNDFLLQAIHEASRKKAKTYLTGIIDLKTGEINLAPLNPRPDEKEAIAIKTKPLITHLNPKRWDILSPRLKSFCQHNDLQGPTGHQQVTFFYKNPHDKKRNTVSANDFLMKRGIAINIDCTDEEISIIIDGKSGSINQYAPYLVEKYLSGVSLKKEESIRSRNEAKKARVNVTSKEILYKVAEACKKVTTKELVVKPKRVCQLI